MKVFLAGASGALGRRLIPQLIEHGHSVVGTTRTDAKAGVLRDLGADPVVLDALDRDAVVDAVVQAQPDAIVHQLTALSDIDFRKFERSFELTDRLRTEGTDNLLAAAEAVGVPHFVAQSYAGWPYARVGGPIKSEQEPLDPHPAPQTRRSLEAIRHLEMRVTEYNGIVLRYGGFYGPGTGFSLHPDGDMVEGIRKRKFPVVGPGTGVWSFVHIEDAASATVAATEHGERGIYNVVDDDPAPVSEWLPGAASAIGARKPMRLPRWVGRLAAGEAAVVMMNEVRGASNAKAKRELGWKPRYASWRQGFADGLG